MDYPFHVMQQTVCHMHTGARQEPLGDSLEEKLRHLAAGLAGIKAANFLLVFGLQGAFEIHNDELVVRTSIWAHNCNMHVLKDT